MFIDVSCKITLWALTDEVQKAGRKVSGWKAGGQGSDPTWNPQGTPDLSEHKAPLEKGEAHS